MKRKILSYRRETDDFFEDGRPHSLPPDYRYLRTGLWDRIWASVLYGLATLFSSFYCRLILHLRVRGGRKLRKAKGGCFIYGNHTQPVGDVFLPALAAFPRRIYTVVSPANLDLPVLGHLLPHLGALPLPDTIKGMGAFEAALRRRAEEGHPIAIYPEAHVWPYYTGIRPFSSASFAYPVKLDLPTYTATAVYRRRSVGGRPRLELYIDGPFYGEGEGNRAKRESLWQTVRTTMEARAARSDQAYVEYRHLPPEETTQ